MCGFFGHGFYWEGEKADEFEDFMGNPEIRNRFTGNIIIPANKYNSIKAAVEKEYKNLNYADLSYADLSGANLNYADLSEVNLNEANLSKADLSKANLSKRYPRSKICRL